MFYVTMLTTAGSGAEIIHVFLEHVHDSPKVNVFYVLSKGRVYGSSFFMETITGIVYLSGHVSTVLHPSDEDDQEGRIHFQQDDAPLIILDK
jgi:hypothetical protein